MILSALVRADRGAIASKFIRLSIEVFHRLVGDHRVVFDGIFFARLVDHFTSDVGAPLRHTDCDVEVAEGHDGDDERKVPAHMLSAQFKGMGVERERENTRIEKSQKVYDRNAQVYQHRNDLERHLLQERVDCIPLAQRAQHLARLLAQMEIE